MLAGEMFTAFGNSATEAGPLMVIGMGFRKAQLLDGFGAQALQRPYRIMQVVLSSKPSGTIQE